jgi:hypothetical protein
VNSIKVKLEAFGDASPLLFDINSVQEAILRALPGITPYRAAAWLSNRPFPSRAAFEKTVGSRLCDSK